MTGVEWFTAILSRFVLLGAVLLGSVLVFSLFGENPPSWAALLLGIGWIAFFIWWLIDFVRMFRKKRD